MMPTEADVRKFLGDVNVIEITLAGSRVTCNPPPENSDYDFLVLIADSSDNKGLLVNTLGGAGFEWEGDSIHYQGVLDNFMSWRQGDVNLIVTSNPEFVAKHKVATALCKRLNLMDKKQRISVFQAILYGVDK